VGHGHPRPGPALEDLLADAGCDARAHGGVGLVVQGGDPAPGVVVAHQAHEAYERAAARVGDPRLDGVAVEGGGGDLDLHQPPPRGGMKAISAPSRAMVSPVT
jgi:hypothetical protein